MVTKQKIFTNFKLSKTLKDISNTLQNLKFVHQRVDEIAAWYEVRVRNSLVYSITLSRESC